MNVIIRPEQPSDVDKITQLTKAAFESAHHSSHTEHFIVNALRRSNQLTVSLVAEVQVQVDRDDEVSKGDQSGTANVVGHIAISPVQIVRRAVPNDDTTAGLVVEEEDAESGCWYGLGPVSVCPQYQNRGIGSQLVKSALVELQKHSQIEPRGCVVLGNPDYYGRFGFKSHPNLVLPGVPPEYFQVLVLNGSDAPPVGIVRYHESFDATE